MGLVCSSKVRQSDRSCSQSSTRKSLAGTGATSCLRSYPVGYNCWAGGHLHRLVLRSHSGSYYCSIEVRRLVLGDGIDWQAHTDVEAQLLAVLRTALGYHIVAILGTGHSARRPYHLADSQ